MGLLSLVDVLLVAAEAAGNAAGNAAGAGGGNAPAQQPGGLSDMLMMMWPMALILVLFYFMWLKPQRSEQSKHQQMLADLKKNDRVVTIGGIFGVVASVQKEADEVTIKVDEATNAKLRVRMSAIARVLGEEPQGNASK